MECKLILILIVLGMFCFPLVDAIIYADKYEWQITYSDDKDYEVYIENKYDIATKICLYNIKANALTSIFMPLEIKIYDKYNKEVASAEKELINKEILKTEKNHYGYCKNFTGYSLRYLRFGEHSTIFEFIKIIKASHLNSTRDFISDVYEDVQERDNNWTEAINTNEYLRITFEQKLTSIRDITIFARSTGEGSASIEVYEEDKDELLATFENVLEDKRYQIFLNNLTGSQDTFDLKVLNNAVEFDYIVDPTDDFYVIELDDRVIEWNVFGDDPYLDANMTNLIFTENGAQNHGDFNFSVLPEEATSINSVNFYIFAECVGTAFRLRVSVWDSGASSYVPHSLGECGSAGWKTFSVPELTTIEEVDNTKFFVRSLCTAKAGCTTGSATARASFLRVDYVTEIIPPNISFDFLTDEDGISKFADNIFVNVSASDENNISTFIDFDDSLIMWMRMDDINASNDPTDYFGIHNGTAINQSVQGNGKLGDGFTFDDDGDYIQIPDDNRLKFGNETDFSISLWMKTSDAETSAIFSTGNPAGGLRNRIFHSNTGTISFNINDGTNNYISFGGSVVDGEWHHVVGVADRDANGTLYIDGVKIDSDNLSSVGDIDFVAPLFIGKGQATASPIYFNGEIDDFIIFNRTLTAEEVKGLFANKSSEFLQINYTNLDDGEHTFIAYSQDLSGNVNMTETRTVETGGCWDYTRNFLSIRCGFSNIGERIWDVIRE